MTASSRCCTGRTSRQSWPSLSRPPKPFASAQLPPARWSQVCLLPGFLPLCFHVCPPFYLFAAGVPNTFMFVLHFICLLRGFQPLCFHICPSFYLFAPGVPNAFMFVLHFICLLLGFPMLSCLCFILSVCCWGSQHSAFIFVLHFIYMCMSSYLHMCWACVCMCVCMCVWVRTCVCLCTCVNVMNAHICRPLQVGLCLFSVSDEKLAESSEVACVVERFL